MEAFGAEALGIQSFTVWTVLYICGMHFVSSNNNYSKNQNVETIFRQKKPSALG